MRPDRAIPTRGATGRKEGMMNKEKEMQKKQRRKENRIKKAIVYWKKRHVMSLKNETCNTKREKMNLKNETCSTKREKMQLSTLATKQASKKVKCYRQYKSEKVIIKKSNESEHTDWWKRLASWKMNTKRKILKGSTDVYLLKRTIEP